MNPECCQSVNWEYCNTSTPAAPGLLLQISVRARKPERYILSFVFIFLLIANHIRTLLNIYIYFYQQVVLITNELLMLFGYNIYKSPLIATKESKDQQPNTLCQHNNNTFVSTGSTFEASVAFMLSVRKEQQQNLSKVLC